MQMLGKICISIVFIFFVVAIGCESPLGLQSKIQKEFDSNPFLKEEKTNLKVIKEENGFHEILKSLMEMNGEELRKEYLEREIEPQNSSEDWRPSAKRFLHEQA